MRIGHRKEIRKPTLRTLAPRRSFIGFALTKGLTLKMSALESLYDGRFTLSTQLIKLNYPVDKLTPSPNFPHRRVHSLESISFGFLGGKCTLWWWGFCKPLDLVCWNFYSFFTWHCQFQRSCSTPDSWGWVTQKHWPPVRGPPLQTGSANYLWTSPQTPPTDPPKYNRSDGSIFQLRVV